jgi:hypothetical protein
MKSIALYIVVFLVLITASCGNDHGQQPAPFNIDPPARPTGLTVTPGPGEAMVEWGYAGGDLDLVSEFRIYYYFDVIGEAEFIAATTDTFFLDSQLVGNLEYCYTVSAVDTNGIEGWRASAECALIETN